MNRRMVKAIAVAGLSAWLSVGTLTAYAAEAAEGSDAARATAGTDAAASATNAADATNAASATNAAIATAAADERGKQPLDEAFDRLVIVPFDYRNKAFVEGKLTDFIYSSNQYRLAQRDGRVLVPIRMMSDLITVGSGYSSMWETVWQPEHPNEVILRNYNLKRTVKFTLGSKTMTVNDVPRTMEIAPQKINGQIMLPLRSEAEALDQKIDWLDGLILIGDVSVDLQDPRTLAVKDRIKARLTDSRQPIAYEQSEYPLTKVGNTVYYYKGQFTSTSRKDELYRRADGQKAVRVELPGSLIFANSRIVGDELYFVTTVDGQAELDAFRFADNRTEEVASLGDWKPGDGWLSDIRTIGGDLYIILHSGDLTMGDEMLYKVENGELKSVATAKTFNNYLIDGDNLYYTDFNVMANDADNLYKVDLKSGDSAALGQSGFAYGINRTIDNQSYGYGSSKALYMKDGYLYVLGYMASDLEDAASVYKIDPADGTQVKLTSPATDFWLMDNDIYYTEASTGYLAKTGPDGGGRQVLAERNATHVQFRDGSIYYMTDKNAAAQAAPELGELYRYDMAKGQETRLSDRSVSAFYIGKTGVYYLSDGYDPGLYRIGEDGRNVRLADDTVGAAAISDEGMVYTLRYEGGIYSAK